MPVAPQTHRLNFLTVKKGTAGIFHRSAALGGAPPLVQMNMNDGV